MFPMPPANYSPWSSSWPFFALMTKSTGEMYSDALCSRTGGGTYGTAFPALRKYLVNAPSPCKKLPYTKKARVCTGKFQISTHGFHAHRIASAQDIAVVVQNIRYDHHRVKAFLQSKKDRFRSFFLSYSVYKMASSFGTSVFSGIIISGFIPNASTVSPGFW